MLGSGESDWRIETMPVWWDGMSISPERKERVNYLGKMRIMILKESEKVEETCTKTKI